MKKVILLNLFVTIGLVMSSAQTFEHNYDESLALAKENEKKVLLIFSGSDWCNTCIQLQQSILSTDEFKDFSKSNLVLLELDFPYRKKNRLPKEQQEHNEKLAERYNKEGSFPKIILLDNNENELGKVSYKKNSPPQDFIAQIELLLGE